MESIKFDFNNMFNFNIGDSHGIRALDILRWSKRIEHSHEHLWDLIGNKSSRVKLGLEWANLPFQEDKRIKEIQRIANDIAAKYDNVIFLGIGGSYLGLKAAQDALASAYYNDFSLLRGKNPRIYFEGNNLDPDTIMVLLKNLNPRKTFIVVISKSGETTETKAAFLCAEDWLRKGVGKNYGRQIFAITDPDFGSLRKRVKEENQKDRMSFRSLPLFKGVGGRYSEFNMGLLHLALIGVRITEVLNGAKDMLIRCKERNFFNNPAYMYALLHYLLYQKKNKTLAVIMPFSETLKSTAEWYVQLLAESLGKKYLRRVKLNGDIEEWVRDKKKIVNIGRTPIPCRGTGDLHSVQQNNVEGRHDKVVTFIKVKRFKNELKVPASDVLLSGKGYAELINLAQEATEWALAKEGRPSCVITLPKITPYYWGALLLFFQIATAFEGELLNVNAFDQPGVEGYKNYMYYKLGKSGISKDIVEDIKSNPLKKEKKYIL
jgi:glucose-6-phosphate isomerase